MFAPDPGSVEVTRKLIRSNSGSCARTDDATAATTGRALAWNDDSAGLLSLHFTRFFHQSFHGGLNGLRKRVHRFFQGRRFDGAVDRQWTARGHQGRFSNEHDGPPGIVAAVGADRSQASDRRDFQVGKGLFTVKVVAVDGDFAERIGFFAHWGFS